MTWMVELPVTLWTAGLRPEAGGIAEDRIVGGLAPGPGREQRLVDLQRSLRRSTQLSGACDQVLGRARVIPLELQRPLGEQARALVISVAGVVQQGLGCGGLGPGGDRSAGQDERGEQARDGAVHETPGCWTIDPVLGFSMRDGSPSRRRGVPLWPCGERPAPCSSAGGPRFIASGFPSRRACTPRRGTKSVKALTREACRRPTSTSHPAPGL